jgi:hypothetical protein
MVEFERMEFTLGGMTCSRKPLNREGDADRLSLKALEWAGS